MEINKNHGQDDHATTELQIRQGAYLPHWTRDGSTYSVTFRLVDSLPKQVLEAWLFERQDIVKTAQQLNRPLSENAEKRLRQLYSEKVEKYLDSGKGACWMKDDRIAKIVVDALKYFHQTRYDIVVWCIMPNHVHVILRPLNNYGLPDILHSWKSFTAKKANKSLRRTGEFWQAEYYDHLIRNVTDFIHCVNYVLNNPENAGMKGWKWVSSGTGILPVNHGQDDHATTQNHGQDDHATL